MSHTQVQLARGNSGEVASYTGPPGEIVVNSDDFTLHVQDGVTAGGHQAGAPCGGNYAYQQPTSGVTLTASTYLAAFVIDPSATLSALTVVTPPTANDGQFFELSTTHTITALTVNPASGQSVTGGSLTLAANTGAGWRYRATNNTWYRRF
ncbi:MAG TPA: hypothetical protein VGG57_02285 [Stellaceae bacterium]|jgi:hypothetical protein